MAPKLGKAGPRKKLDLNPIYDQVSQLLLVKNPEQISFSMVAQKTKVPRTTLYYYFGSDVQALILQSVRHTLGSFLQILESDGDLKKETFDSWDQLQTARFLRAIKTVLAFPTGLKLYLRYCDQPSSVGHEVRHLQDQYLKATAQNWTQFNDSGLKPSQIHLLAQLKVGILWGLTGKQNTWNGREEELAATCTALFRELLKPTAKNN
jgi:AcrR family transcriptional regulator